MNVSVIIPALNEERTLPATLRSVHSAAKAASANMDGGAPEPVSLKEILVVDGGSTDDTVRVCERAGREAPIDLTVVSAPRGRAQQMNAGADRASGTVLLFLHADTHLPPDALTAIARAAASSNASAGTFRLRFSPATPLLSVYAACTRVPWTRICFGDRGLFVTREAFDAVGGFPEWPIFEDLEIVDRLARYGSFEILPTAVTTSSRRFQKNGTVRQQVLNLRLWLRYIGGAPVDQLAKEYGYVDGARG